jgi:hypothetical protein
MTPAKVQWFDLVRGGVDFDMNLMMLCDAIDDTG